MDEMRHTQTKPEVLVIGVHLASEAYPNVRFRLADLRASGRFNITEINVPAWRATLSRSMTGPIFRSWHILYAHIAVLWRYVWSSRADVAYVPYPAVFVLLLLSWLPKRKRPRRIVADAFISLYDTVVTDRKLIRPESFFARFLFKLEKKACESCDLLLVDTMQNAEFMADLFRLPKTKLKHIPLSTDEENFQPAQYKPTPEKCRVLFIGTLIPLHGMRTIVQAASMLRDRVDIDFRIVGDGQDAYLMEAVSGDDIGNLAWIRQWQTSQQLAAEIRNADICLGIFGNSEKTQRVCPFKLYAYAAVGRAVITGATDWSETANREFGKQAFVTVPVDDASALAARILELAGNPELRREMAIASADFYQRHLANKIANEQLFDCLLELSASPARE